MYNMDKLIKETETIIANLLADGSDPDALYIIEHHIVHHNFDKLEKLVVEAFKLGYEISDAEEFEDETGKLLFCCDIVSEIKLDLEHITAQQRELIPLIEKLGGTYDGWGTYFEDPNAEEYDDNDNDYDYGNNN